MSDITPLIIPVFDLQCRDGLAPYCGETHVIWDKHQPSEIQMRWVVSTVITSVTLHPDVVGFFLFFLSARIARVEDVSTQDSGTQEDAVLKHKSP
jgi:hypothetical protein